MELIFDSKAFKECNNDELMAVHGGVDFYVAMDMLAIAISIVGIAWTPYQVVNAVGTNAVLKAAAGGVMALVGLVSSLT